jgi:hypothetical protein
VNARQVFQDSLNVIAFDDYFHFGVLSSALHWWWVLKYASTLEGRIRYTPSDVFETFPMPMSSGPVAAAAIALDGHRSALMVERGEGLTATYNRVNDPEEESSDISRLRSLHVALDEAVAEAYGWDDVARGHGHYETRFDCRFTVSTEARDEILARLLEYNHARYAEEVAAGLHERPSVRRGRGVPAAGQLRIDAGEPPR